MTSLPAGMPGRKGGVGGPPTSFKDFYQPGNRHFAFPPVRAARARKAAMGSDFEIYCNLAMEKIEQTFPWTKAHLHDVSPRTFGVVVCFFAFTLGSVFLYVFLGLGAMGADYYKSLTPVPPPPPPNLMAPVNPLRGVAGCPDMTVKEAKPGGMPSGKGPGARHAPLIRQIFTNSHDILFYFFRQNFFFFSPKLKL